MFILLTMKTFVYIFLSLFASAGILLNVQKPLEEPKETFARENEMFEKAVAIIKKYEGLSNASHYPFVGYGHLIMPGEKFTRGKALSQSEAEKLLRKDLKKLCSTFRQFGKDSLILGVLAYNIGPGNVKKSTVFKKLSQGNRDIEQNYLAHNRYKGKVLRGLKNRRIEEFNTLFLRDDSLNIQPSNLTI